MTVRQRLAHVALGGVLVLLGAAASEMTLNGETQQVGTTDILKAQEFHVVSPDGSSAAIIAAHPSGRGLAVKKASGELVMGLHIEANRKADIDNELWIADADSRPVFTISTRPNAVALFIDAVAGRGGLFIHDA